MTRLLRGLWVGSFILGLTVLASLSLHAVYARTPFWLFIEFTGLLLVLSGLEVAVWRFLEKRFPKGHPVFALASFLGACLLGACVYAFANWFHSWSG